MMLSTRLSQTSHCLLRKWTCFACLCGLGTLKIDGLGRAHYPSEAKNFGAFWGSLELIIGNMFWYCSRKRPKSRWHLRAWQSCYLIPEVAGPLLAWWRCVLLPAHWGAEDGQSHWWEECPDQQATFWRLQYLQAVFFLLLRIPSFLKSIYSWSAFPLVLTVPEHCNKSALICC